MHSLSIVHRIYISCALLVVLIALVGGIAAFNSTTIQGSLSQVTQDANRLNALSGELREQLLSTTRPLASISRAHSLSALDTAEAEYAVTQLSIDQIAEQLNAHSDRYGHDEITQLVTQLDQQRQLIDQHASEMARLQREVLRQSDEIDDTRRAFLLNTSITTKAINRQVDPDAQYDGYIKSMQDQFNEAREMVQFMLLNVLSDSDPQKMAEALERAQYYSTQVRDYYDSLRDEVPALEQSGDVLDGMKQMFFAVEDHEGVIARHVRNVERRAQVQQQLVLVSERIEKGLALLDSGNQYVDAVIQQKQADADGAVSKLTGSILVTLLLAIGIALAVAWGLGRMIRIPLQRVMTVLEAMANGDFRQRLEPTGKDEFSMVARSVGTLADTMNDVIRELHETSAQLNQVAQRNAQASTRAHAALERQNAEVQGVAAAITQMESAVQEIARNTDASLEQTLGVENQANQGQGIMADSITTISQLAEQIDASNQVIGDVNKTTSEINKIVDVINDIANKTNLLALNAAIEAARAGEQGRGFAVVADEVRQLASQTAASTDEIQSMITQLQQQSDAAVTSMASSVEEMHRTKGHIEQASESMHSIQEHMVTARDMANLVSEAASQQTLAAEEITRNVNVVSEVSNENFAEIEGIATTTVELNSMAEQQETLLARFAT